jgi:hypothetical protein
MSSDCLQRADDAKQRAAQATEPSIKSAYEKVAEYWMLLARLESLVAAEKIAKTPRSQDLNPGEVAITAPRIDGRNRIGP